MSPIHEELRSQIEEYLLNIPEIDDEDLRKQIARNARFTKRLFNKIEWNKQPSAHFVSYLLDFLIEWGDIDEADKRNSSLEYLKATQGMVGGQARIKLFQLLQSLEAEILGSSIKALGQPEFKFINREQEISELTDEISLSPRHAIHAPAGFGKSWLLTRLRHVYLNKGWVVCNCSVGGDTTLTGLAQTLINSINPGKKLEFPNDDIEDIAEEFSGALKQMWESRQPGRGIVLLIDTDTVPREIKIFDLLLKEWLPAVIKNFQGLVFFGSEMSRFRIILAGRFFDNEIVNTLQSLDGSYSIYPLSAFSDIVLARSVNNYLSDINSVWRTELWSTLFYHSGGHPGIFNRILQFYQEQNKPLPRRFFEKNEDTIQQMVNEEIKIILEDIPDRVKELLIALSPFRYLSYDVLEEIITSRYKIPSQFTDFNDIVDKLTQTYLVSWDDQIGHLLRDTISRRIMAIYLRSVADVDPNYIDRCYIAKEIYRHRLIDLSDVVPATRWAVEYLFQALQIATKQIGTIQGRRELRRAFWGETDDSAQPPSPNTFLYNCLTDLIENRDMRIQIEALQRIMHADWEFKFNVNYYLRDDIYNQIWFGVLLSKTQSFLKKNGGS